MFRGIVSINLDPKGRLAVPARYRGFFPLETQEPHMVLTIDTQAPCLLLYPFKEWIEIEEKLQKLSSFNPATRRIQRLLIGHATELEIDAAGRILVPSVLRDYACLTKEVMMVGQAKKCELWDKAAWHKHREQWLQEEADLQPEGISQELLDLAL